MFSNDLDCTNSRGVLIYVDKCLDCSEITIGSKFGVNVFIRINPDLVIGNIYRSPNGSQENDMEVCDLIGVLSKNMLNFFLLVILILVILIGKSGVLFITVDQVTNL